jgi:hypothetical protein
VPISAWEGFEHVTGYPCCTAVVLAVLAADSGKLLWKTYTIAERPHRQQNRAACSGGFAGTGLEHPTIDASRHAV